MTATTNLLVAFLGLEVFSVSGYALAGLKRGDDRSAEAAVKYFLTGSFALGLLRLRLGFDLRRNPNPRRFPLGRGPGWIRVDAGLVFRRSGPGRKRTGV
ncbi:MAG: hypothetical protein MZV70_69160 [Desulfobacterales bacterium]|nr:hypothetical protein [Desulfobacterales bacterium]